MTDCLFCKIRDGEIPSEKVFENDDIIAFRDVNPQAPTHILIIPNKHIPTVNDLEDEDAAVLGEMMLAAQDIANYEGIAEDGYRLVINCNAGAGQAVYHIHMHLLGGRAMTLSWLPGCDSKCTKASAALSRKEWIVRKLFCSRSMLVPKNASTSSSRSKNATPRSSANFLPTVVFPTQPTPVRKIRIALAGGSSSAVPR